MAKRRVQAADKVRELVGQGYRLADTPQTSRTYKVTKAADKVQRLVEQGYRLNPKATTSRVYRDTAAAGDKWAQRVKAASQKKKGK